MLAAQQYVRMDAIDKVCIPQRPHTCYLRAFDQQPASLHPPTHG